MGKNVINRRLFITSEGEVIKTDFDVRWYAIDLGGYKFLYGTKPKKSKRYDWWSVPYYSCSHVIDSIQEKPFDWKKARWYLKDNGEWVRR